MAMGWWKSGQLHDCAGLVTSIGSAMAPTIVAAALGSAIRPPPDLLGLCAAVDEKAAELISARDQALLAATAALQACSQRYLMSVLRLY
jgi:hypothetical protein